MCTVAYNNKQTPLSLCALSVAVQMPFVCKHLHGGKKSSLFCCLPKKKCKGGRRKRGDSGEVDIVLMWPNKYPLQGYCRSHFFPPGGEYYNCRDEWNQQRVSDVSAAGPHKNNISNIKTSTFIISIKYAGGCGFIGVVLQDSPALCPQATGWRFGWRQNRREITPADVAIDTNQIVAWQEIGVNIW